MADFVEVARLDQIAPGTGKAVTVAGSVIALFNLHGQVFAVDDACVRCGSSLAAGTLRATNVTCSGCDWQYDVTTGCLNGIPALRIDTFEVKIVEARVLVAIPY